MCPVECKKSGYLRVCNDNFFSLSLFSPILNCILQFCFFDSKYTGDKWDSFYDKLPISLVNHINGNAVYNITHPLLEILIQRLEDEANTPFNAIPYDYRISQIMAQAKTGTIPEIPPKIMESYDGKEWSESVPSIANVLTSVQRYISKAPIKQTSLIANYAATNIVTSHIGREHIIHGAVVYEELKRSSQVRLNMLKLINRLTMFSFG